LRDPDTAKDYKEKLEFFNSRKSMIGYLNLKYGPGSKLFLDILETFREDPSKLLQEPNNKVKTLIKDTYDKLNKERI
jgi:hypothetical protein